MVDVLNVDVYESKYKNNDNEQQTTSPQPLPYFEQLETCACCVTKQPQHEHCRSCIEQHYFECLKQTREWADTIIEEERARK